MTCHRRRRWWRCRRRVTQITCAWRMGTGGAMPAIPFSRGGAEARRKARYLWHDSFVLRRMTRLVPDPELEQLVRELNEAEAAVEGERSAWPAAQVPSGNPLE